MRRSVLPRNLGIFLGLAALALLVSVPTLVIPLAEYRAGVSAELHMYAGAGHGFGVRESNKSPAGAWIVRFHEWLADRKFLSAQP